MAFNSSALCTPLWSYYRNELKAVLGHEIAHLKHRDMIVITILSAIPLIMYWIAWRLMWGGMLGDRRKDGGYAALIEFGTFILYFLTNCFYNTKNSQK